MDMLQNFMEASHRSMADVEHRIQNIERVVENAMNDLLSQQALFQAKSFHGSHESNPISMHSKDINSPRQKNIDSPRQRSISLQLPPVSKTHHEMTAPGYHSHDDIPAQRDDAYMNRNKFPHSQSSPVVMTPGSTESVHAYHASRGEKGSMGMNASKTIPMMTSSTQSEFKADEGQVRRNGHLSIPKSPNLKSRSVSSPNHLNSNNTNITNRLDGISDMYPPLPEAYAAQTNKHEIKGMKISDRTWSDEFKAVLDSAPNATNSHADVDKHKPTSKTFVTEKERNSNVFESNAKPKQKTNPSDWSWTNVSDCLKNGNVESAYEQVSRSGDVALLVRLMGRTGPVLSQLSQETGEEVIRVLLHLMQKETAMDYILPWMRQLSELTSSEEEGSKAPNLSREMKRQTLLALAHASHKKGDWVSRMAGQIASMLSDKWQISM